MRRKSRDNNALWSKRIRNDLSASAVENSPRTFMLMPNPKSPSYKFKKAWSWPTEIEAKIKTLCEGTVLHVCCGDSTIGDVRIDLEKPADIKASMFYLPIRPASFDTVLCDPPWELPY